MTKGIVYYKLKSQYEDDITKDCGLDGYEVDGNFNTLEGRDIQSLQVINGDVVITLYNGKTLSAKGLVDSEAITALSFDKESGVLSYTQNGETYNIRGFASTENTSVEVSSDATLTGAGTSKKPLGISNLAKTGVYKPVKRVIDLSRRERLPNPQNLVVGDRFLSVEAVSDYGYLYDLDGVRNIACDLHDAGSKWRISSLDDWDDMLNAVEPNPEDRNHGSHDDNRNLGRWAGKLLKSKNFWVKGRVHCDGTEKTCIDYGDGTNSTDCSPAYCGEYTDCDYRPSIDASGVDKYGFRVTPAGFADDGENYLYFKERAVFWTSANHHRNNAYTKRFEFNRTTVHQEILAAQNHLSLRLVKDYDGDNFFETEDILDTRCDCVLMPSLDSGHKIWTSVNFASANKRYHGLIPNDGAGVTNTIHFFINEWDGRHWQRNEIREGEGVVVIDAPHGNVDEEYRIVDNKLTSVTSMVKDSVVAIVRTDILKLRDRIERDEKEIGDAIDALQSDVDSLKEANTTVSEEIADLQEKLTTETEERKEADEALQTAIDELKESSDASIQEVKEALETETNERKEADETEATARTEADEELQKEIDTINSEISDINGDITSLQGDVKDIFGSATKNDSIAFDPETGLLTSQTLNGTANTVQFSFNFGTF
ncbi:MAG: hypothetical protein LUD72_01030 [Bacteroidales bacterium]|nr:hypothetical protein [Bacteroidales bacterium]